MLVDADLSRMEESELITMCLTRIEKLKKSRKLNYNREQAASWAIVHPLSQSGWNRKFAKLLSASGFVPKRIRRAIVNS